MIEATIKQKRDIIIIENTSDEIYIKTLTKGSKRE
jgi:hypothetical protein